MAIVYINGIPRIVSDSAPRNYVPNTNVETSTADFTTSGPGISFTRTTTGSETVRGGASLKITTTASCTTSSYITTTLGTFDAVDTQAPMRVAIDYRALTGYISGYMQVVLHDGTNEITPTITSLPSGKGRFEAYWTTTSSTSYTIRLKVTTAGAGQAFNISIDNIRIDPTTPPQSVRNYVVDGDFENGSTAFWNSSGLVTIIPTTSAPLRGSFSGMISASSSVAINDYTARPFTIDTADKGKIMRLEFDYAPSTGYDAADASVYIRDVTNSTDIIPAQSSISGTAGTFITTFGATSSTSYELRFKSNVASSAWDLKVDGIRISAEDVISSDGIEAVSLAYTYANNTGLTIDNQLTAQRVGEYLTLSGYLAFTGTGTDASAFTMNITGLTLTASIAGGTARVVRQGSTVANTVSIWSTASGGISFYNENTDTSSVILGTDISNSTTDEINAIYFESCTFRVTNWIGQKQYVGNTRVEHLINTSTSTSGNDTSTFGSSTAGTAFVAISSAGAQVKKRVQVQNENLTSSTQISLQVSQDGVSFSEAEVVFPYFEAGAQKYGMKWERVSGSTTQIDVIFGGDGANGLDAWSSYTTWKWKIVKSMNPLSIGVQAASTSREGIVSTTDQTFTGDKTFAGKLRVGSSNVRNESFSVDLSRTGGYTGFVRNSGSSAGDHVLFVESSGNSSSTNVLTISSTSGTIGKATADGAWTLGQSGFSGTQAINGNLVVTNVAGNTLVLSKSNDAPSLRFEGGLGTDYSIDINAGTLRFYNDAGTVVGSTTQAGLWTLGVSGETGQQSVNGILSATKGFNAAGAYINGEAVSLADGETRNFTFGGSGGSGGIFICTCSGTSSSASFSAIFAAAGTGSPVPIYVGSNAVLGKTDPGTASKVNYYAPSSSNMSITNRTGSTFTFHVFKLGGY